MKNLKIKYNPFVRTTEVLVDGKHPKKNSSLNFGEHRLQEWAGDLPEILSKEYADRNFSVEFTGTLADFEDLKLGLSSPTSKISVTSFKHNRTTDVIDAEAEVGRIFEEIKSGPIPELRDQTILTAFEKAKNSRFEINVVATMSSGKSTLINALLDHKLMPVAAEATTATIVSIIDTDIDGFRGVAFDQSGKIIEKSDNLTYSIMKEWNNNKEISQIDIEGRIPCVNSIGMRLVLVDTPGPNNSGDPAHRKMTYGMLEDSDKSLVLFVMRGDALGVDDESNFLDYVCETMKKRGKQSRDRYIFVINKLDVFNPEEEDIEAALVKIKTNLEKKGIFDPNIFPVSAQAALEARTQPNILQVIPVYRQYLEHFPSTHFDNYYGFSHLPSLARIETEELLHEAELDKEDINGFTRIEIHSGIVSIEKAIELYINKYARAIKVYDLVQSFNDRLNELATIAQLQQDIQDNIEKREQLEKTIASIKERIDSGESARQLSSLIDKIDLTESATKEIKDYVRKQRTKIDKIIYQYNNSSEVPKAEALAQAKQIQSESNDILDQIEVQITNILQHTYTTLLNTIIKQYESYVKELGLSIDNKSLIINPLTLVKSNIGDIDKILKSKTKSIDKGGKKWVKESYQEKKTNWFWTPWHWGSERYETKYRTVEKWVSDYKEFVNMTEVVSKYFQPVQSQLVKAESSSIEHITNETSRIKKALNKQLAQINEVLSQKLDELNQAVQDVNLTAQELETKKKNLEWMNGIIERINKLTNF